MSGGKHKASVSPNEMLEEMMADGERFIRELQKHEHARMFFAGVLVGIVTLVIIFLWCRKSSRGKSLLLLGTCDAGKTALFSQLIHRKPVETYTSTKTNEAPLPSNPSLRAIDIPGHERVRIKLLDEVKSGVRGVIYVVDSATVQKQLRDVAEYLFNVLSDPVVHKAKPKVMVACNKQDLSLSKGSSLIRRELEKELGLLRETHARTLQGTDDSAADHIFLGKEGQDFAFEDLKSKVSFCEVSALQGADDDGGFDDLLKWIATV